MIDEVCQVYTHQTRTFDNNRALFTFFHIYIRMCIRGANQAGQKPNSYSYWLYNETEIITANLKISSLFSSSKELLLSGLIISIEVQEKNEGFGDVITVLECCHFYSCSTILSPQHNSSLCYQTPKNL